MTLEIVGTIIFIIALLHTFSSNYVKLIADKFPSNSFWHNFLHFLSEVEIVFGFWAFVFIVYYSVTAGIEPSIKYLESVNFTEPVFVFCIMVMASSSPILHLAEKTLHLISTFFAKMLKLSDALCYYFTILFLGPLLGSFITEPAAMTVCALLLKLILTQKHFSERVKYATVGLLFVNISIGGVLTNFAAPPVLMVAHKWGWNTPFMFQTFGLKAIIIIFLSTLVTTILFRKEITISSKVNIGHGKMPLWLTAVNLVFLVFIVLYHNRLAFFLPLFLIFIGWTDVTKFYQKQLKIRESLLVGFFLAGLVILGNQQGWWLQLFIHKLGSLSLFFGATALTAITDNAALTYLGSLVPNLSDSTKYFLVAGAVSGGGLTVIANAPNPAGFSILQDVFPNKTINHAKLFLGALPATILVLIVFGFL